ncbi:phosphotransferase family protein [Paenibacillus sp. GCM10027626]|uniref:phosphotransferase family protein n=1 Tax=Paenibacillus sp. GCM10027626 TaxID=3273411 RepID=UPI00363A16CA
MSEYKKPNITVKDVESMVSDLFGSKAIEVTPLEGGNLSSVFSFLIKGKGCVVKFSDLTGAYDTESFISELLTRQGVPFPKCLGQGKWQSLSYSILERIEGGNLADCSAEQQLCQLPELIGILTRMNRVELGATTGYGWIEPGGNGKYATWKDYMVATFAEDQAGTFWEGWYDLFQTTCLEKDVFDECYSRLMAYCSYNEPHRHFIHGDFHPWNILSDSQHITGIIDGNCAYGDFLVDLATLEGTMPKVNVVQAYVDYQEQAGIHIPDFKERLIGAHYFKGMDGLRFYAKMGWKDSYCHVRDFLLNLTH